MKSTNRMISRLALLLILSGLASAQTVQAKVIAQSVTEQGYFSGRGTYSGPPADVVAPDSSGIVVNQVMTNAAVIPRSRPPLGLSPLMPWPQAIQLHQRLAPLRFHSLF